MGIEQNKKIVTDFFAHFGESKDVAGGMAMMAEDGTWWIGGKPELLALAGTKSKLEMTAILNGLVPVLKHGLPITIRSMIGEGDKVAVEAESYGEHPNGRIYNNEYHFLIELREDKILRVREYLDTQHIAAFIAP